MDSDPDFGGETTGDDLPDQERRTFPVLLRPSFIDFVLPFTFDASADGSFEARCAAIASRQAPSSRELLWAPQKVPYEDLLRHAADHANPDAPQAAALQLWDLTPGLRQQGRTPLPHRRVRLVQRAGDRVVDITDASLALFRVGVGFLTFRTSVVSDDVGAWLDVLHFFRFFGTSRRARLETSDEPYEPITWESVVDGLLGGGETRWWSDIYARGEMLPYYALFTGDPGEPDAPFLQRVRGLHHSLQQPLLTGDEGDLDAWGMRMGRNQWLLQSLEGGGLVSLRTDTTHHFTMQNLPQRIRRQYFLVFLFALHQRFTLLSISQQLSSTWLDIRASAVPDEGDERALAAVRRRILDFAALGRYADVMQHERQQRAYLRWQQTLNVERLYGDVRSAVRDVEDHLSAQREERTRIAAERTEVSARRFEQLVLGFGLLIGIPSLALTFLGVNLSGLTAGSGLPVARAVLITVAVTVVFTAGAAAGLLVSRVRRRRRE